jgi:Domain of unknown function (DUF4129)
MRSRSAFGSVLVACLAVVLIVQPSSAQQPLTVDEYVRVLDGALASIRSLRSDPHKADEIFRNLPSAWHVDLGARQVEISTEPLRQQLLAWQSKHDEASLDGIIEYLEFVRDQTVESEQAPPESAAHRAQLNEILSRREFRDVHGQTWIDRLKQRISDLIRTLLSRVVSSSAIPVISDVLVYALIIIAVLALAYWMYRSLREGEWLETIMPTPVPVSAKAWPIWLAEARTAAGKGDWNNAVHFAYWAGISFLEAQGAWQPDVARTPREYLRLLAPTSTHRTVLRSMTTRLETVWYGMQFADENEFRQAIAELESLGCRCN